MTLRANFCIKYASSFVHLEDEINPKASGPFSSTFSLNLEVIKSYASSHVDSTNSSPLRIKVLVRRSSLFTKSQPNLLFTQVEIPFAGASFLVSILRMSRPFVHTSNEQPTPQNVHTVLVFLIRSSRKIDSVS